MNQGRFTTKHGHAKNRLAGPTKEYRAWISIRRICLEPSDRNYRYYGDRGIRIADEWRHSFEGFLASVGLAPSKKHILRRYNLHGDFVPGNVGWVVRVPIPTTSDGTRTKEYRAWNGLKQRCLNANNPAYSQYGGRGIGVQAEWAASFEAFLKDVGFAPSAQHTLDRIDVNGNYERGNVRWATRKEQSNNVRRNLKITVDGITRTVNEWADAVGLPAYLIANRIKTGWSPAAAVNMPRCRGRRSDLVQV